MGDVRVVLAEDMHLIREALVALIRMQPGIEVVGEVRSGDQIVPMVRRTNPDVVIADLDLPGLEGVTAAVEPCPTLILTAYCTPANVRRALAGGAAGFMVKDTPAADLAAAIHAVAAGHQVMDPRLAALARDVCPLTKRENEVLDLLASGKSTTEISRDLFLAIGTVRNYVTAILVKLNARNHVDAIRIANKAGWLR